MFKIESAIKFKNVKRYRLSDKFGDFIFYSHVEMKKFDTNLVNLIIFLTKFPHNYYGLENIKKYVDQEDE